MRITSARRAKPALPGGTIPQGPEELTPEWLTAALRSRGAVPGAKVREFRPELLGEGEGFVGQIVRLHLVLDPPQPDGPATLIAKFPIPLQQNRALGEMMGAYEREIRFYEELAREVGIRTPRCYYSAMDPNPLEGREEQFLRILERTPLWLMRIVFPLLAWLAGRSRRRYVIFLEDLAPARVGDQVAGCTPEVAERSLRALAPMHARFWNRPQLEHLHWIPSLGLLSKYTRILYRRGRPAFLEQFGTRLPDSFTALADWLDAHGVAVIERLASPPFTLMHGDYRLDNLCFGDSGDGPTVSALDWQGASRGRGALDVSYFITGNLDSAVSVGCESDLLHAYHDELSARGVAGYSFEACERDYQLAKLFILYRIMLGTDMLDLSHERGAALLDAWIDRLIPLLPQSLDGLLD